MIKTTFTLAAWIVELLVSTSAAVAAEAARITKTGTAGVPSDAQKNVTA